jgi:hypothetical protein
MAVLFKSSSTGVMVEQADHVARCRTLVPRLSTFD